MMTGQSLNQLATELERQLKSKRDFKAPTIQMEVVPHTESVEDVVEQRPNISLSFKMNGSGEFHMTSHFHDQLGAWAGIPSKYYDRMQQEAPQLLSKNLNWWLTSVRDEKTGKYPTRLIRTLDGQARAFLSNRYRTIDNWDVADTSLPVLSKHGCNVVSSNVDYNKLYIKAMTEKLTIKVKKGDIVQGGVVISNSEVGQGSVRVEPFLYRLVCLNGMIIPEGGLRKFHIGRISEELEASAEVFKDETRKADDKAFMMKLRDILEAAFDKERFTVIGNQMMEAEERKMTAPPDQVIEEVVNRWHLKEEDQSGILKHLVEGGSITQWGVANAITRLANDQVIYEKATTLERIGGEIAMMNSKEWKELAA